MIDPDGVPDALKERDRWLMWSSGSQTPRRPHVGGDYGISFNDPDEWLTFEDAVAGSKVSESWGIGFVFTPDLPIYAIDVDGVYDERESTREWFPGYTPLNETYLEYSPSGKGLHAVLEGSPPQWWRDCEIEGTHQGVECLTNSFCTITGDVPEKARRTGVQPVEQIDVWFTEVFHRIRGHLPGLEDAHPDQSTLTDAESRQDGFERDLGPVTPEAFPPCIQALTERVREGEPMNHRARFALASFLASVGMDADDVVEFLDVSSEFGQRETAYQVNHIDGSYDPPSCRTMIGQDLCVGMDDRCETICHPLQYYEGASE